MACIHRVAALLLVIAAVSWLLLPSPTAKVVGLKQITRDGLFKGRLVTDGSRVYFPQFSAGHMVLGQVSALGGDTLTIPVPFQNVNVFGLSSDGSALLISEFMSSAPPPFWAMPFPTGSLRRLILKVGKVRGPPTASISYSRKDSTSISLTRTAVKPERSEASPKSPTTSAFLPMASVFASP
jgi:hypothetical protein